MYNSSANCAASTSSASSQASPAASPLAFTKVNLSVLRLHLEDLLKVMEAYATAGTDPVLQAKAQQLALDLDLPSLSEDVIVLLEECTGSVAMAQRLLAQPGPV